MKKLIVILFVTLISLTACMQKPAPEVQEKEPFIIGAVLPLTGWNSFNGEFSRVGIDAAVEDLNKKGGINGREVKVIYEEGAEKKQATIASQKLVDVDGVDAFVSTTTAVSGAIAPVAEANNVPFIYLAATNAFAKDSKFVFKDYPDAFDQCEQLFARALKEGHTKIALFGTNLEFSEYCLRAISKKTEFTTGEVYAAGEKDYRTALTKIKSTEATALIVSVVAADCPYMYKQLREMNANMQIYIVFQSLGCGNIENTVSNIDLLTNAYGADIPQERIFSGEFADFKQRFEKAGSPNVVGSALMYDAVQEIAVAAQGCEDSVCLANNLRVLNITSLSGEISFGGDQIVERKSDLTRFDGTNWKLVSE